ncbi:hypothetical protein HUU05_18465 [candidate division KSB1 bacterium]|nr:hypothetical protein [candidate division KSB1 bacterium]
MIVFSQAFEIALQAAIQAFVKVRQLGRNARLHVFAGRVIHFANGLSFKIALQHGLTRLREIQIQRSRGQRRKRQLVDDGRGHALFLFIRHRGVFEIEQRIGKPLFARAERTAEAVEDGKVLLGGLVRVRGRVLPRMTMKAKLPSNR